jgi:DNA-binding response OmpR family regulator
MGLPVNGMQSTGKAITIVIVDDDCTSLVMIEKLLQREGYTTLVATEGEGVLDLVLRKHPDLVLLDVNLPGISGQEVCRQLKENVLTSEVPVLFLSAETGLQCKIDCFDSGGQDYITKPFEPLEVLVRVRTHLRLRQAQNMYIRILSSKIDDISKAQTVFQPIDPSEIPDANCAVHFQQFGETGGDLYDIIKAGEELYDYITADVCGHTSGLALATAALKTMLIQNCTPMNSPADVLTMVNKVIPSVLVEGQYVSFSWVRINRVAKKAYVFNAGQPPVIYIPAQGSIQKIDKTGDIVGIFSEVRFEHTEINVKTGDRFALYSDGLIEITKGKLTGRNNGIKKLIELCEESKNESKQNIIKRMISSVYLEQMPEDNIVAMIAEV